MWQQIREIGDGDVSNLQIGGRKLMPCLVPMSEASRIWRIAHGVETRQSATPEEWERALKKAIERAGPEERPKILDLDF
jgi:hypothetical protein